jgi:hypothetical protein
VNIAGVLVLLIDYSKIVRFDRLLRKGCEYTVAYAPYVMPLNQHTPQDP